MLRSVLLVTLAPLAAILACGPASIPPSPQATTPPAATAGSSPTPLPAPPQAADIIFLNGNVITMDDAQPSAQAVALWGDRILAVGSDQQLAAYRGAATLVVDMEGGTLVPGFIDAHQHRIGDRGKLGIDDPAGVIQPAIQQGWTSIHELYVDQARLEELIELDGAGVLRLHVNAYLPVNENSREGRLFEEYYRAYRPGDQPADGVRVAGLKVFVDFDNATVLLWSQEALDEFVLERLQEGWQLAVKTVSSRSLEMILQAVENAAEQVPDIQNHRVRLEHMLFATPDQIDRIQRLGLVPVVNLNVPGQLIGEPDIDGLIEREPAGSYAPWRSLAEAGVPFANTSGWPSFYVDEPTGAPFGSPIHLIYQAVTRVGNLGTQPYPWLLDQALSPEQAMRALTIDGAFAAFEEDERGSLTPGKVADLVLLSGDPFAVPAERINFLEVWMTMIRGVVAWCAPGHESLCPGAVGPPIGSEDPFVGGWSATDPADGSAMTLEIERAGDSYEVVLIDALASICGVDAAGAPLWGLEILANGAVEGGVLRTTVTELKCLGDPPTTQSVSLAIDYAYREEDDTLFDSTQDVIWHRR